MSTLNEHITVEEELKDIMEVLDPLGKEILLVAVGQEKNLTPGCVVSMLREVITQTKEFCVHPKEVRRLVDEAKEEARAEGARESGTIISLLEQMIEMNGEGWFWSYLAKMPITKFNHPLKKALTNINQGD